MNKENCTKGPVNTASIDQDSDHIEVFAGVSDGPQIAVVKGTSHTIDKDAYYTGIANAELIAEAFNVLHETGMTPRELAKQVRHLSDTMHSVADSLTKQGFGYGRTKSKRGLEVQEAMLIEVRLLNTVLAKHQPTNA